MPAAPLPDKPTFYRQEQASTCAIACLRMVLSAYQLVATEKELAERAKTNEFGTELGALVRVAQELGFECEAKELDFASLPQYRLPIVYLDGPTLGRKFLMHAVVVEESELFVKVLDPAVGAVEFDAKLFCDAWEAAGNYAVVVRPKTGPGK